MRSFLAALGTLFIVVGLTGLALLAAVPLVLEGPLEAPGMPGRAVSLAAESGE
ncbi:MAG: hypothetical protein HYY05_07115, partial [Chloroflexi bacterium]|nr:hypothetical protein [Chloroflexota bacterium]